MDMSSLSLFSHFFFFFFFFSVSVPDSINL